MFACLAARRSATLPIVGFFLVSLLAASVSAQAPTATSTATPAAAATTTAESGPAFPAASLAATPSSATPSAATGPDASPSGTVQILSMGTKQVTNRLTGGLKFLVIVGVFVVPIVLANVFSKAFRMPDHVWRFFFVLLSISAGSAATLLGWPPKLGVDLQGGVNLIYEISQTAAKEGQQNVDMEKMVGTISRRVNPGGVKEVTVRPFGIDKIEIIIPGADQDELDRTKKIIGSSGALEFLILASRHKYQNEIDAALAQQRTEEARRIPLTKDVYAERGGKRTVIARWVPVATERDAFYRGRNEYATREVQGPERMELQVLCTIDPYKVTGDYLTNATPGLDQYGKHCVIFSFNGEGAGRMLQLTSSHMPDPAGQTSELGIVLDGYLQSAPAIRGAISDRGEITGDFSEQEVKDLSEILTAGALPAALDRTPVSEVLTGPTLGADTIKAGITAMGVAVAVVVAFMLVYYRFAGMVANIALILNVLLTVAFMVMFNAAFTLSGLAGLALTVGMAVDANVLIYERMREELSRGATLRMAIRNGFDRASVTIIDANVTTLITAIVLYTIGTDQIKGFAVALTVGLCWNLFTAITVSRLLFETAERARWISNLKFMQLMTTSNYDFIGKRYVCYTLSIIVLGAGLIGIVGRGQSLLNIDFTGGSSITLVFENPPKGGIGEVREKVEKSLPEATVQSLKIEDKEDAGYKIVTADPDKQRVEDKLKELFGPDLAKYRFTPGKLETIAALPAAALPATGPSLTPSLPTSPLPEEESQPSNRPQPGDGAALDQIGEEEASSCDQEEKKPAATATATAAKPTATAAPVAKPTAATATATPKPAAASPTAATPSATAAAKPSATAAPAASAAPTAAAKPTAATAATPSATAKPTAVAASTPTATAAASTPAPKPTATPAVAASATATPKPTTPAATTPAATTPAATTPAATTPAATTPAATTPAATATTTAASTPAPTASATGTAVAADATIIDPFAGGTFVTLNFEPPISEPKLSDEIRKITSADPNAASTLFDLSAQGHLPGSSKPQASWNLRVAAPQAATQEIVAKLGTQLANAPFFPSSENVGAAVAAGAQQSALVAITISLALVLAYIWFRFQNVAFGFAAIVALAHDVLFTLGCLALSKWLAPVLGFALVEPFKIDLTIVAAILTIIGYSLNDTIVIFDRIREVRGKSTKITADLINTCVNQTLSRTILTSLTVFMVVVILYIWGGPGIHGFAFALVVGTISGTYSTIYVASPVLLWLHQRSQMKSVASGAAARA